MRAEVDNDPQVSEMMKNLQQMQMQIQAAQVSGQEPPQELVSQMQSVATMVATKPLAAAYMQAEGAFSLMMNDVFGILGEAMGMK